MILHLLTLSFATPRSSDLLGNRAVGDDPEWVFVGAREERLAADGQGLLESVGGGGCVAGGTGPASGLGAVDHLGLGEAEESPGAVLDADAAPLGTAEGLVGGQCQVGVDPRGAALQVLGDLRRSLDVGAPHRAGQPVVGGVGPLDDLVDVAVGDDGQRWTEMLLVDDPGADRKSTRLNSSH